MPPTAKAQPETGPFTAPEITLPKGGGAIRGLGEKFQTNPANGTGTLSVPIPLSKSRGEFQPALSLSYSSGSGNGPYGLGWSIDVLSISRRTDKGVPRYGPFARRAADIATVDATADIFLLSGSEDLVAIAADEGPWIAHRMAEGHFVRGYRPRIEGNFARIESWTRMADGDTHWRTISRDNILTVYGERPESRIADPDDPQRVFTWLACRSYDDRGNALEYEYAAEDDDGVDTSRPNERFRSVTANRYLKRIRYGNRQPLLLDLSTESARRCHLPRPHVDPATGWLFEIVFDYGDEPLAQVPEADGFECVRWIDAAPGPRATRLDPFSMSRAGFEIRTYRLCRRILLAHRMPEELGTPRTLVRGLHLDYEEKPNGTRLSRVTASAYRRLADGSYRRRSLPAVLLHYSPSPLDDPAPRAWEVRDLPEESLENLPVGIAGRGYQWTDLDGEGISGVLTAQAGAWFYKPNRGNGRFGAVQVVRDTPPVEGGRSQLIDLDADGRLEFAALTPGTGGFFDRTADADWTPFRPFRSLPIVDFTDPNLRLADLSGDGLADILITDDQAITWHPSLGDGGFGEAVRVRVPWNDDAGPRVLLGQANQSIFLADMSGDGLTDLVRIRNGEVCYWQNLGYGRFGPKVTMDGSPWLDHEGLFDARRVRLADTDGSGPTDLIYAGRDGVTVFLNESGNGLSAPRHIAEMALTDGVSLDVVDLLGRGTACLVWSTSLPGVAWRPVRYIDLMCGAKPHLLVRWTNQLGAETRLSYASSTEFYLADRDAGRPWVTRLPFPVHVVKTIETIDQISNNRFVSSYRYHHGHYDGVEREFRGFGMVEQQDSEWIAAVDGAANWDAGVRQLPVLTKTWFHTGHYDEQRRVSRRFAEEYYREPNQTALLPDTIVPAGLTFDEEREACRALKGSVLRQETYGLDDSPESGRPYSVLEANFTIRLLQPRGANRYAIFHTHPRESLTLEYERRLYAVDGRMRPDPRVSHQMTLAVDDFGNGLESVAIGYGRRYPEADPILTASDHEQQARILVTSSERQYSNAVSHADAFRAPLQGATRTREIAGIVPTARRPHTTNVFDLDEMRALIAGSRNQSREMPFADWRGNSAKESGPYSRLLDHRVTRYRANHLDRLLPIGQVESLALPGEHYMLAFPDGLLEPIFADRSKEAIEALVNYGGYVDLNGDGQLWRPSGRVFYAAEDAPSDVELSEAAANFFLQRRVRDPFGHETRNAFDAYRLSVVSVTDALGNSNSFDYDYRVLAPFRATDPNGNRTQLAFDTLGLVAGTAVMGKEGERLGDSLDDFAADLDDATIAGYFEAPLANAAALLRRASTRIVYDLDAFTRRGAPVVAASLQRETHDAHPGQGAATRIQHGLVYSDGFGRELQRKAQAEPGPVGGEPVEHRWVGTGWTVYNNKGKPVRQFEPFFTDTHRFEFDVRIGVSPVMFYDPPGRVVVTLHPNHTYEKVVFDPWQQTTYDVNDTCAPRPADVGSRRRQTGDPRTDPDISGYVAGFFKTEPANWQTWYAQRVGGALGQDERSAALRAEAHADTPITAHFDALGRPFLNVARNRVICQGHDLDGVDETFATRVDLDIESNQRAVRDERRLPVDYLPVGAAETRIVMHYDYDMLGNRIHQRSSDAGARWTVSDVAAKPIRAWDSRGHSVTTTYDRLRRPVEQIVRGAIASGEAASDPRTLNRDILVDRIEYGETLVNAEALNLRTRVYRHFDAAGVVINARLDADGAPIEAYDFKGNLLHSTRRLARDYTAVPDWSLPAEAQLDAEVFEAGTRYDALNRPIQSIAPHSNLTRPGHPHRFNVIQPVFNEANLLERVDVWLDRDSEPAGLLDPTADEPSPVGVANIDYDAKGQRQRFDYKNGARTVYEYDSLTFRLTQLVTERTATGFPAGDPLPTVPGLPGRHVQNLHYTYDPAGNITHVQDDAQQTTYFRNRRVEPSRDYTYDALYRLIQASGREHLGQRNGAPAPPAAPDVFNTFHTRLDHPGDGNAMGTYIERYIYAAVGSLLQMQHRGSDPANAGWTRVYDYLEPSLLEDGTEGSPLKNSNRLSRTTVHPHGANVQIEPYQHDAHGNMVHLPHLGGGLPGSNVHWDYKDQLRRADLGGGGTAYYVYDASGQRVRKVWEKSPGLIDERLYLGGVEIFRRHGGPIHTHTTALVRETLHVMDDERRIALVETRTLDTGGDDPAPERLIRYQLGDHLDSASLELDEQARIISYEEYTPYGNTSYQSVRSQTETPKRYRYTGKERDEESGLYYHGARYYASWLARWSSPDPAGVHGSVDLYMYALGRPTRLVDSTGLWPEWVDRKLDEAANSARAAASSAHAVVEGAIWNPTVSGTITRTERSLINFSRGKTLEMFLGNVKGLPGALGATAKDADRALRTTVQQIKTTYATDVARVVRGATRDATRFIANNSAHAGKEAQAVINMATGTAKSTIGAARSAVTPVPGSVAAPKVSVGLPGPLGVALKALAPVGAVLSAVSLPESIEKGDVVGTLTDASGFVAGSMETGALALSYFGGTGATGGTALIGTGGAAGAGLSTGAAVVGSFAAGLGIGRLLDWGSGKAMGLTGAADAIDRARDIRRGEGETGDYSISGVGALAATEVDEAATSALRAVGVFDKSKPAYTQTLGWRLAEVLPSWLQ